MDDILSMIFSFISVVKKFSRETVGGVQENLGFTARYDRPVYVHGQSLSKSTVEIGGKNAWVPRNLKNLTFFEIKIYVQPYSFFFLLFACGKKMNKF